MKIMLALLLAMLVLFSLAAVCFADGGTEDGDSPVAPVLPDPENKPDGPYDESLISPDTGIGIGWLIAALVLGILGACFSGKKLIKRLLALALVFTMCAAYLPMYSSAEESSEVWIGSEESALEDASAQLGEYTEPAESIPAESDEAEESGEETEALPDPDFTAEEAAEEATEAPREAAGEAARSVPHRAGTATNEGRDYAGQVTMTVTNGDSSTTDYILIGSKQQLQAIDYYPTFVTGSTDNDAATELKRYDVTGPIWRVKEVNDGNGWIVTDEAELVYPGDADLVGDYADYPLYGVNDEISVPAAAQALGHNGDGYSIGDTESAGSGVRYKYYGGTNGSYQTSVTSYSYGKYSPRNNFVVFRDIDMNNENWTPLMFYGLMYGVDGSELNTTLATAVRTIHDSGDAADYAAYEQPTISNVYVSTGTQLNALQYQGVGFFATVTSSRPGSTIVLDFPRAEVRNLRLEKVNIQNNYTSIQVNQTVVNELTSTLGSVLGTVLDGLLGVLLAGQATLSVSDFADSLEDLLNARATDKTNLATGGFTGRVYGDVLIEKCDVDDVQVKGAGSYTGGFVGYSAGEEKYDGLSQTLQATLDLLGGVLNVIPGLGLGDLIGVVQNVLPLGKLIPVDYLNPHVEDCGVTHLAAVTRDQNGNITSLAQTTIGPDTLSWSFNNNTVDAEFNGGFIGCKIATVMINCGVHDSDYHVYAKNYGGGFAGIARDAVIQELLTDLGANLGVMQTLLEDLMDSKIGLQSMQVRCNIMNSNVTVSGGDYLGGFNGAMCNAYCVNNEVIGQGKTLSVSGTGDSIGGFAGIATLGWGMSMGQNEQDGPGQTSLLSTLKNVLSTLLSSYGDELLNLLGVGQSEILGLQFDYTQAETAPNSGTFTGGEATVSGYDYVGGLVGKSDALIMTGTNSESLSKLSYIQNGDLTIWDIFPDMPRDSSASFTVTYKGLNGATITTQTANAAGNYMVTLPSGSDNGNYVFLGWVSTAYDHVEARPVGIHQPGELCVVTNDFTFYALYSIAGAYYYELITSEPSGGDDKWLSAYLDGKYVFTWGRDDDMIVLGGISGSAAGATYQSDSNGGAAALADISGITRQNRRLYDVPDQYVFVADNMAGQSDYFFQNLSTGSYPGGDRSGIALTGYTYTLKAYNGKVTQTQWHSPAFGSNQNVLLESDNGLMGDYKYLVYDETNGYFRMGTQAEATNLYLWGRRQEPTQYTTVATGETPPTTDDSASPSGSNVGRFAKIHVKGLRQVDGHEFVGGIVGLTGTANVGGLLNDTLSIGDFRKFEIYDVEVIGGTVYTTDNQGKELTGNDGLKVYGSVNDKTNDNGKGYYVAGGFGLAMGGDLLRITIDRLNLVEGENCVGGFVGCAGPGELLSTGGLNLQLLGMNLLTANNLLNVGQGIETTVHHDTVTGIPAGYTVEAKGVNGSGENRVFCAGGFFGRSNSTSALDCHAVLVKWVKANTIDGRAGGFIGVSEVGGLASMDDSQGTQIKGLLDVGGPGGLLNAVGYLIPEYTDVDVYYVDPVTENGAVTSSYVEAAWAGGFAADFQSGTVDNSSSRTEILDNNQTVTGYNYTDCVAVYNIDHVTGTLYAGGFGANLHSGALADAGGGISILGALDTGSIGLNNLLSLVNAYVPKAIGAGVKSSLDTKLGDTTGLTAAQRAAINGFIVTCTGANSDMTTGSAGGFVGYSSGAQISYSDVNMLRHTTVTPPEDLDGQDGSSYFGSASSYAVTSTRYGGGYAGYMDIGSSASLGGGLSVISAIQLSNVLDALNVVISTIEHSDVYGGPGGFAVLATWNEAAANEAENLSGRAGGFVGWSKGGHIQDSHSWNFSYIISQIAAGGYAGEIQPGSVADALGSTGILNGLVSTSGNLLQLAEDFVPTIRNSVTTCIPCGGAVRADAAATTTVQRGMAGGYVGHNQGGQIWGNNDDPWKDENSQSNSNESHYNGPKSECAAIRILSVYGYEHAGGFTGLMDAGSTADTGSLSLLWGLVNADNLLGALKIAYATEENTAVYGPLSNPMVGKANDANHPQVPSLSVETWNAWAGYIGVYGGYGMNVAAETVNSLSDLNTVLAKYTYGYHVTAGRDSYEIGALVSTGGYAGGYVGAMRSGTITNGQAHDAKQVVAMHAAGGFAGEMKTGSSATLGSINALGLPNIDLGSLIPQAASVFVPTVKTSSVHGYQNGLTVRSFGTNHLKGCGDAGGYAGFASGAQVWGDDTGSDNPNAGCNVYRLKLVQGTRNVGGYFGTLTSGSTAEVDTNVTSGLVQDTLDALVSSEGNLLSLLNATISTVRKAELTVADPAWGFTVEGWTDESGSTPVRHVPLTAGGFVGAVEGAVIGNNKRSEIQTNPSANITDTNIVIHNLRGVEAQHYAGGFFGVADEGGAASIGGNNTSLLLKLVDLGQISALDMFRPYIYNSNVAGVSEGFTVRSSVETVAGIMASTRYGGCSGGFGGALLNGTVENSNVTNLSSVTGPNYVAGFVGYTGKSGVADVDDLSTSSALTGLLGVQAGVADVIGSTIEKSSVTGIADLGYTVEASGGSQPIAGGFVGYGDLAQIGSTSVDPNCTANNLKYVTSDEVAGGFIGQTSLAYLVEAELNGALLSLVVGAVNELLNILLVPGLENANVINLDLNNLLGVTGLSILQLKVLHDGDLVYVDLLGLKVGVSLAQNGNAAEVRLGDSSVTLPVTNGQVSASDMPANVRVKLFRTNHTRTTNSRVTGISALGGYDVFGGGATQDTAATAANGATGGFVGLNEESTFVNCKVLLCDTVRGTADKTGPFSGQIIHDSVYERQSLQKMEGPNNGDSNDAVNTYANTTAQTSVTHNPASTNSSVFVSSDKVVLMEDKALEPNPETTTTPTAEMQNPCKDIVDLTLFKVWEDPWNLNKTRNSVTFTIHQRDTNTATGTYTDAEYDLDPNTAGTQSTVTLTEADANTFTSLVWEKKLTGLPATYEDNGTLHRYSYYVTEANSNDYVQDVAYADTGAANKLMFAIDGTLGYVAKLTNQAILEQVIVVDYGLPVQVSVMQYLEEKCKLVTGSLSLQRILASTLDATLYVRENDPDAAVLPAGETAAQNASLSGIFGDLKLVVENSAFRLLEYTPKNMQMTEPETVLLRLLATGASSYSYTRVTFVPATNMYYEAESPFLTFTDGTGGGNPIAWGTEGNLLTNKLQGEDRPAQDILDDDNVYGYDAAYSVCSGHSLGQSRTITVSKPTYTGGTTWPTAEFTFTGTGFDILGLSDSTTGYMNVKVYKQDAQGNFPAQPTYNWAVNTFFGLTGDRDGYARYVCTYSNGAWHANATLTQDATDPDDANYDSDRILTEFPKPNDADQRPCVVYQPYYSWNSQNNGQLYQTPILTSEENLEYGTYKVVLTVRYNAFYDKTGTNQYSIYLDGVRIYNPAQDLDETYYLQDHEAWPEYFEMRDCLLTQESFQDANTTVTGAVFIDGKDESGVITDYTGIGPNNEIYLKPGQAVAFQLQTGDPSALDRAHVSLKLAGGSAGTAQILVGDQTVTVNDLSATERYYDLGDVFQWTQLESGTDDATCLSSVVVIRNPSNASGVLSVRNLKFTYSRQPSDAQLVRPVMTTAAAAQALEMLSGELPTVEEGNNPSFYGVSISLKSDIALNYYVPMSDLEGASDIYVLADKDADGVNPVRLTNYTTKEVGGVQYAVFTFRDIPAKEMTTTVRAQLFLTRNGVEQSSDPLDYSVKQYAMEQLAATSDPELKTLLVDMLNYGTWAQVYFAYRTGDKANADLTDEQDALGTQSDPTVNNNGAYTAPSGAQVVFEGVQLRLVDRVEILYNLNLSGFYGSLSELRMELKYDEDGTEKTVIIDGAEFVRNTDGSYTVCFDGLNAAQMRTVVHARVLRKSNNEDLSGTCDYSIESYAATAPVQYPELTRLMVAMMRYGDAASAYFTE